MILINEDIINKIKDLVIAVDKAMNLSGVDLSKNGPCITRAELLDIIAFRIANYGSDDNDVI